MIFIFILVFSHGAGGLAGQHRLGARHGASVVFLGLVKMMLAIFLGKSALTLLDAFPTSVLGVMLAIAGQELATTGFTLLVRSVEDKVNVHLLLVSSCDDEGGNSISTSNDEEEDVNVPSFAEVAKMKSHLLRQYTVVAVITAMVIISLGKTHYGALSGWVAHMIYGGGISELISWYRSRRNSNTRAEVSPTTGTDSQNNTNEYNSIQDTTGRRNC